MYKRKKKKRLKKQIFNRLNIFMLFCSVMTSYFVVSLSNPFIDLNRQQTKYRDIEDSTYRIAEAFEEYNLKRFRP